MLIRVDRWLGLAHANGLAAAAVLFIESTSQMSTRNSSNRILVLCWIVLTLLLGPPSTVILLMKNITWETWQACTLLTLQTHVVVALGEVSSMMMNKGTNRMHVPKLDISPRLALQFFNITRNIYYVGSFRLPHKNWAKNDNCTLNAQQVYLGGLHWQMVRFILSCLVRLDVETRLPFVCFLKTKIIL